MSAAVQVPREDLPCECAPVPIAPAVVQRQAQAEPPETVIEPARGWQPVNVAELWQFRELIAFLIWRDVKIRYKQTALGAAWAILQPAMMMVVLTVFFAHMAHVSSGGLPYEVFVYAGLLPWTFFAAAIANSSNSIVSAERLITKIYFPRLAIPFAAVGAAVVDFTIAFGLLVVLMIWYGVVPGFGLLLVPVIFGIILLAAVGVGTLLAALNVSYRDFRHVVPMLIQVWMFATPTIYLEPTAGGNLSWWLLRLNPLAGLIAAFRAACLGGDIPWMQLGISSVVVVVVFVAGCFYFRKAEDGFADII
jgi:lipopolysaccharide transport system permease protein